MTMERSQVNCPAQAAENGEWEACSCLGSLGGRQTETGESRLSARLEDGNPCWSVIWR